MSAQQAAVTRIAGQKLLDATLEDSQPEYDFSFDDGWGIILHDTFRFWSSENG